MNYPEQSKSEITAYNNEVLSSDFLQNESLQQPLQTCPKGTVCLLLFNQAIAESIAHNLNARGQYSVVIAPHYAEAYLKHNHENIALAVLSPRVSSYGEIGFDELLNLVNVPFVLIDYAVRTVNISKSLQSNSRGYLTYDGSLNFLLNTISKLASGEIKQHWCPEAAELIDEPGRRLKNKPENPLSTLTPRQFEVLIHLAEGKTVKEVAQILHLSHKSVDSHKYRIMNRLKLHDRVHLARFAIREGLIEP